MLSIWVLIALFPQISNNIIHDHIMLQNHSGIAFERFEKSSQPRQLKLYFFNVSNAAEYRSTKQNTPVIGLKFEEIGPYVYDVAWHKMQMHFDKSLDWVNYSEVKTYTFNSMLSGNLSEDDIVQVANIGLVSLNF